MRHTAYLPREKVFKDFVCLASLESLFCFSLSIVHTRRKITRRNSSRPNGHCDDSNRSQAWAIKPHRLVRKSHFHVQVQFSDPQKLPRTRSGVCESLNLFFVFCTLEAKCDAQCRGYGTKPSENPQRPKCGKVCKFQYHSKN